MVLRLKMSHQEAMCEKNYWIYSLFSKTGSLPLEIKKNNKLKKIVKKSKLSIYYFFPAAHIESIGNDL